jgi:hypothetical protein
MREYQTTGIIRINSGYIGLDKRQAGARRHLIRPVKGKKGVYEVLTSIELKAGEVIGLEKLDKGLRPVLELTQAEQARQAAAKKQAAAEAEKEQASKLAASERNGAVMTAARQAVKEGFVTAAGAPLVEAMEAVAGFDISSKERDAAWDAIQSEKKVATENQTQKGTR